MCGFVFPIGWRLENYFSSPSPFPVQLDGAMPWGMAEGGWLKVMCTTSSLGFPCTGYVSMTRVTLEAACWRWQSFPQFRFLNVSMEQTPLPFCHQVDSVWQRSIIKYQSCKVYLLQIASVPLTPAELCQAVKTLPLPSLACTEPQSQPGVRDSGLSGFQGHCVQPCTGRWPSRLSGIW